jgi:hypothetical protein
MSLITLPVNVNDIDNLQDGTLRQTNGTAPAVVLLINGGQTTVFAYGNSLLDSQPGHASEVTDAVVSAFDGVTPTAQLLNNVVLNFLPGQIAFAVAQGLNQTVYAAETVGLALLSNDNTFINNIGSGAAFANTAAGNQAAAQAIVSTVFGSAATQNLTTQALAEMNFWIGFYTAHPNGTGLANPTADQILIAARSTTAGDMVGVAIDGNIGTLKTVAGSVLLGDGLFLNNEGPATLGGIAEPGTIAIPPLLQGSPFQVFTLTIGTDTFTGNGNGNGDNFNGPLAGAGGGQNTLTDFDNLTDSGINANLNVVFDGGATVSGVNIQGIPNWNIQNHTSGGTVSISGGSGKFISGLTTLNYNANGGASNLEIGTAAFPIVPTQGGSFDGFIINVMNAGLASTTVDGHVNIAMAASGFSSSDAITVKAQGVGNNSNSGNNGNLPAPSNDDHSFEIAAGSPTAGFSTWNVQSFGAFNNIGLGADGSGSAASVFLTDFGNATTTVLWAASANGSSAGNWGNVTTLDASGTTGTVFVTGAGNAEGFLEFNNAITTLIGGSGVGLYDLSSLGGNGNGVSIDGGGNVGTIVELNNSLINAVSEGGGGFAQWTRVPTIADLSDGTNLRGLIDMSRFPGTTKVILAGSDSDNTPDQNGNFVIRNAPSTFEFDFQSTDQHGFNVEFDALPGGNLLTVNYDFSINSTGHFASTNFDNVVIDASGFKAFFYAAGVTVEANVGDAMTLTFNDNDLLLIAVVDPHTSNDPLDPNGGDNPVGTSTLTLHGGNALHPTTGTLDFFGGSAEFGVTNASTINSTGGVLMRGPDNVITVDGFTGVTINVAGGSDLQGSMGFLTDINVHGGHTNGKDLYAGNVGTDTITDTGNSSFWGDGGADTINLGGGFNEVNFGDIFVGGINRGQIITNSLDHAFQGFWGAGNSANGLPNDGGQLGTGSTTSADMTTISGFDVTSDALLFNSWAWAGGGNGPGSLVTGGHGAVGALGNVNAVTQNVTAPGAPVAAGTDFVLYNLGLTLGSASDLATALTKGGIGDLSMNAQLSPGNHMLFAYISTNGDLKIADVDFLSGTTGATHTTAGQNIVASDIADLPNVTLLGINPNSLFFQNFG